MNAVMPWLVVPIQSVLSRSISSAVISNAAPSMSSTEVTGPARYAKALENGVLASRKTERVTQSALQWDNSRIGGCTA